MALFKCKMCGGSLEIAAGTTVIECEYCGTQQTLPKLDDDKRANMYDRANHFRRNNEFDKAMGIYEDILNEDNTDAEAYWSLVLCRYGIEYVEDPVSHKRLPTVNRAQFTSIFDDDNYKSALQYADSYQRIIYEEEAKAINEIQKGILAISQKEEPFDVFICYKETDASGRRTQDSVLAQDLYYGLKNEGFKVFFARITLENKLGSAYEPYIFAALNSAKVMVVLGTKPEFFNAVWVKNEWSRYLSLIKQGQKKMLIPAYKDMDPYDLPEEFSHLQAQDMSKLGFMQDLIRGIQKIVKADEPKSTVVKETVVVNSQNENASNPSVAPLLKRVSIFLEDGKWEEADAYCEKVLDLDPENAQAYLGKLLAELQESTKEDLRRCGTEIFENPNFEKAFKYAEENDTELLSFLGDVWAANCVEECDNQFTTLKQKFDSACSESDFLNLSNEFKELSEELFVDESTNYQEILRMIEKCKEKAIKAGTDPELILMWVNQQLSLAYGYMSQKAIDDVEEKNRRKIVGNIFDQIIQKLPNERLGYIGKAHTIRTEIAKAKMILTAKEKTVSQSYITETLKLINYRAFPDQFKHDFGQTLLCSMCYVENIDAFQALIDMGANIEQRGSRDGTPLWTLCHREVYNESSALEAKKLKIAILLNMGASINVAGYEYGTAEERTPLLNSNTNSEIRKMIQAKYPQVQGKAQTGGCYVATCVYGSYDCPQVWTLRRYRDDTLGSTWYGRLFIRTYYAISPTLVKLFGKTNWFKKLWKGKLDRMVAKLQSNGVEDTPYEDKEW